MSVRTLAAGLLCLSFALPAQAQGDAQIDTATRKAPRIAKDPTLSLRLPADLPAPAKPDAMTGYLVPELRERQSFAFDPASFRLTGEVVMLTVTATSQAGARTSGYYAINCDNGQYRLLGFPSAGKWKASTRAKWRKILGAKQRPSQLIPLFDASCKATGLAVDSATDLANRLQEFSDRTN